MTLINGKVCRWYAAGYVWVSEDGCAAYTTDKTTGMKKGLFVEVNKKTGIKTIHLGMYRISMERAVITCFCPPKPNDGKKYRIRHRDGNISNCHKYNLIWELDHYKHNPNPSSTLIINKEKLTIIRDGSIWRGKQLVSIIDYAFDSDVNRHFCTKPHIRMGFLQQNRYYIDDLMKEAGYVNGDDVVLNDPVILHRDYNRMNFAADNLEWCESTDSRYVEYQKRVKQEERQRCIELNPGQQLPVGWY